jgi:hypothetical protein
MKRTISAAAVAWVITSLSIAHCGGRTDTMPAGPTEEPNVGGTIPRPSPPAPAHVASEAGTSAGDDGSSPPPSGDAAPGPDGSQLEAGGEASPDDGGPPLQDAFSLPTPTFFDGGFFFDTGTSYSFDSGMSLSIGDGGIAFH